MLLCRGGGFVIEMHLQITLSGEMAEMVRAKVESGEYASASEVVLEGLRALRAQEHAFDNWMGEEVAPDLEAIKADPNRGLTPEQVKAKLADVYRSLADDTCRVCR